MTPQEYIIKLRDSLYMTQAQFATVTGVDAHTVMQWETWQTQPTVYDFMCMIRLGLEMENGAIVPPGEYLSPIMSFHIPKFETREEFRQLVLIGFPK